MLSVPLELGQMPCMDHIPFSGSCICCSARIWKMRLAFGTRVRKTIAAPCMLFSSLQIVTQDTSRQQRSWQLGCIAPTSQACTEHPQRFLTRVTAHKNMLQHSFSVHICQATCRLTLFQPVAKVCMQSPQYKDCSW